MSLWYRYGCSMCAELVIIVLQEYDSLLISILTVCGTTCDIRIGALLLVRTSGSDCTGHVEITLRQGKCIYGLVDGGTTSIAGPLVTRLESIARTTRQHIVGFVHRRCRRDCHISRTSCRQNCIRKIKPTVLVWVYSFFSQCMLFSLYFVHFFIVKLMRSVIFLIKLLCMHVCMYVCTPCARKNCTPVYVAITLANNVGF